MQRLLFVVVLAIVVIGLPLFVLGDSDTPPADAAIPKKCNKQQRRRGGQFLGERHDYDYGDRHAL